MTVRTSVAFDPATAERLDRLAKRWGVSKSDALRRALETGEQVATVPPPASSGEAPDLTGMTASPILDWIAAHPLNPGGGGKRWSAEIRAEREAEATRFAERASAADES